MSLTAASAPEDPATTDHDHHGPIEVDDSDYDSGFTGATNSSITSVSSSVLDYQYENGRRYSNYKDGYVLPNDETEQDRLDLVHHVFSLLLGGKLYLAPLDKPQRVLDIGTGTGAWAIDFADENEQAEVLGNDLSPIQPTWVPLNLRFEVDDVEQPWTHQKNSFDYIHMRYLSGCFKNWHEVLRQCFEHLKPGAYLEFQDYGSELLHNTGKVPDSALAKWWSAGEACALTLGRPFVVAKHMQTWMQEVGFVNVHVHKEILPMGPWPKDPKLREKGRWGQLGHIESLEPFGLGLLTRVGGWTVEAVREICKKAEAELLAKDNRYYNEGWFVYGQKPGCDLAEEEN